MKKKVVIIGAGPAGLTAAYELLKNSIEYDVVILEECSQVGGISKTVNYKENHMDLGGHRFFSKSKRVNDFWLHLMPLQKENSLDDIITGYQKVLPEKGPDPEKDDIVMLKRNRVSRIYYKNKFFDYPVSLNLNTIKNMGFKDTIKSGFSYLKSMVVKKDETNLENFFINRFGKNLYRMFFKSYTEKIWGRSTCDIDASWGAQRVKGISIKAVLVDSFKSVFHIKNKKKETSLIEEYLYPKYGPGQMWELVAEEIKKLGGKIILNSKVYRLEKKKDQIIFLEYERNGKKIKLAGDIFISSMPIKDLVENMNDVPKEIRRISQGLPYRSFVTIGLLIKKLKLKNETKIKIYNDSIPDCWIYIQDEEMKMGRIQVFNNWSPYMVKDPINTVWIGLEFFCDEGDSFWNMSERKCADLAIEELVKMQVIDEDDVLDFHREKAKKAYPAYFDTYGELPKVIKYLNEIKNLYCIGRNGQHRYNNMDHSMMCAFETVDKILKGDENKDSIWQVNAEKEYHEEK